MLSELRHTQIQHMIQSTLGGRLTAQEKAELEAHLEACAECRSYQAQMLALDSSLKRVLHASREGMQSPDYQRSERIVRRIKRRIMFKNKLNFALYGAFLVVMVLVVLFAVHLVTQPGPQPVFPSVPLASPVPSPTSLPKPQVITPENPHVITPENAHVITPENAHALTRLNFLGIGAIHGIAWSPDGKQIAAATSSGIYLVDMTTLAEKHISTSLSTIVSFSHDGSLLASAEGSIVKVIDVSSEKVLYELKGHTDTIHSVAFSPVENIIATGSGDETVRLWDANRGEELHTLAGHTQFINKVFFSPDGKYLVSAAYQEPSTLWDVASGQELRKFNGTVLTFSPDGTTLASGSLNRSEATIKLWDSASGEELSRFTGAPNIIPDLSLYVGDNVPMDIAYSPDGTILASKSLYSSIILWDISGREELRTIQTNEENAAQILFSPDGKQLALASLTHIEVWNTATGELIHRISLSNISRDYSIRSLVFSPKGDILAAGGDEGTLKLYSVPAGELLGVLDPEFGIINSIAFSPDGNILAAGGGKYNPNENGIVLWDMQTRKLIWGKVDFPEVVSQVVFSPDGTELAAVYNMVWMTVPTVQVWSLKDLLSGSTAAPLYESKVYTPVLYNQDGVLLSLATTAETEEPTVYFEKLKPSLWDIKNSRELAALGGSLPGSTVADMIPTCVDFSPDGSYVLFGAAVGDKVGLNLWNVVSGRQVSLLDNPAGEEMQQISSVDFSPDGRMFAAAGWDKGGVSIWSIETGELLVVLDVQFASVVAFSPDGTLLATGSANDIVRLWGVPVDREAGKSTQTITKTSTITHTPTAQAANIIYVKADVTSICNGPGNSWANPCSLASALAIASGGTQIWVAAGTYKPTTGTDRAATFSLRSGVEIYGGFAGNETRLDQRGPKNVTILSGDIGTPNDAGNGRAYCDNSYHVVTGSGADATAILDGFTITLGNAFGSSKDGGGMYIDGGSPTLRNLIFSNNGAESFGGGMANYNSNPSLTNVTFSGNSGLGGGMFNSNSSPSLTNVTFSDNLSGWTGGGMANDNGSNPSLTNVTFSGNMGGGMINKNSNPSLTNVTFFGNEGGYGGMGNFFGSKPNLVNCIMWGNEPDELDNYSGSAPNITYSDIQQSQGVYPGAGNINADPLFVNAPGDLHLQPGSPALNAGNNAAIPDGAATDLDGQLRIQGGTVDMGAYEYGP